MPALAAQRARELGIEIGELGPGPANAITDVAGVRVGHTTLIEGDGGAHRRDRRRCRTRATGSDRSSPAATG